MLRSVFMIDDYTRLGWEGSSKLILIALVHT